MSATRLTKSGQPVQGTDIEIRLTDGTYERCEDVLAALRAAVGGDYIVRQTKCRNALCENGVLRLYDKSGVADLVPCPACGGSGDGDGPLEVVGMEGVTIVENATLASLGQHDPTGTDHLIELSRVIAENDELRDELQTIRIGEEQPTLERLWALITAANDYAYSVGVDAFDLTPGQLSTAWQEI